MNGINLIQGYKYHANACSSEPQFSINIYLEQYVVQCFLKDHQVILYRNNYLEQYVVQCYLKDHQFILYRNNKLNNISMALKQFAKFCLLHCLI